MIDGELITYGLGLTTNTIYNYIIFWKLLIFLPKTIIITFVGII